jgi:hypothetical protein
MAVDLQSRLGRMEQVDVEILRRWLPPFYKAPQDVACMVVGASSVREGSIWREYHADAEKVRVAACNPADLSGLRSVIGQYDASAFGWPQGDALHQFTWASLLTELDPDRSQFDVTSIRNPDLVDTQEWAAIFLRAAEWTAPKGVIVTLVRNTDLEQYDNLLGRLRQHGMSPMYSGPTGYASPFGENFHHTIGIFRPSLI